MEIEAQLGRENYGFCIGGSQNWMGNFTGENGFCFQKQGQLQIPKQKMHWACFEKKNGQSLDDEEVDRLISHQNERLRMAVQEHVRQQMESILRKTEAKMEILMKQKDHEIAKALNRKAELEVFLRKMETECQNWQRVATENESMVESLNNTIERYRESTCFMNQVDDSESCCGIPCRDNEAEENICKFCNFRNSRVVLLPCRHLCCCKSCEGFLSTCPICGIVKKASIEAIF